MGDSVKWVGCPAIFLAYCPRDGLGNLTKTTRISSELLNVIGAEKLAAVRAGGRRIQALEQTEAHELQLT
jgi:hypothetical protein